jgi:hypothetical protein
MKLQLVPASRGVTWIRLGMRTFFRQPLALSGLFFMFLAVMTIAGSIPVIGLSLALALLPACTLGLMAASREASSGKFPMPTVFLSAFRAGRQQVRAMMLLGVVYGTGFWVIMGVTALFDGGGFATGYIAGKMPTMEMARDPDTQTAMLAFLLMQFPLSLMFWHAPALVHWHAVPAAKSIFFSLIACLRNFWAFVVFGIVWMSILMGAILLVSLFAGLIGSPEVAGVALMPAAMLIAAMFFTSTYFSFRDCFDSPPEETP